MAEAAKRVAGGHDAQVDALVEPGQPAALDQQFTSLGIHHFLLRLYRDDLEGAARLMRRLPAWSNGRISSRISDKYLGQILYLQAESARREGGAGRYKLAGQARRRLESAGATQPFAEPGTRSLWCHLVLVYFTHALNQEVNHFRVDRLVRRGLSENQTSALLFYELAHVCTHRGKTEEAVDHLARALYYARGEPFYLRAVLDAPEVERVKPALVAQVKSEFSEDTRAN